MFSNYTQKNHFDLSFDLVNTSSSIANTIRRTLLSELPIISFSDDWNDNESLLDTKVKINTTSVHNEFITHRLSLIPICMFKNEINKIKTYFDNENNIRKFAFENDLIFNLKVKNDDFNRNLKKEKILKEIVFLQEKLELIDKKDEKQISEIKNDIEFYNIILTNNNITVNSDDILLDNKPTDFIQKDIITNEFIKLLILKINYQDDDQGEEIDIDLKLTCGTGKKNSRYCPVGTVTLEYNCEDDDTIEEVFKQKIEYMNTEREKKKINILTDEEVEKQYKSFLLLDKQRIYKKDEDQNANNFHFRIQSIGHLKSVQLFYDSLKMIELKLFDILKCFTIDNYNIQYTDKFEFRIDNDLETYMLIINNETHTLSNIINEYMNKYIKLEILKYSGYKLIHPLKEIIHFKILLNDKMSLEQYKNLYKKYFNLIDEPPEDFDVRKNVTILIFLHSILELINELKNIQNSFLEITNEYYELNSEIEKWEPQNSFDIENIQNLKGNLGNNIFNINDTLLEINTNLETIHSEI